jgi:DNA-directed RNA polymerase specialized sigma24 family protein
VYRIAYNLCVDHQRRNSKLAHVSLDADDSARPLPLELDGPPPDEPFERDARRRDRATRPGRN